MICLMLRDRTGIAWRHHPTPRWVANAAEVEEVDVEGDDMVGAGADEVVGGRAAAT